MNFLSSKTKQTEADVSQSISKYIAQNNITKIVKTIQTLSDDFDKNHLIEKIIKENFIYYPGQTFQVIKAFFESDNEHLLYSRVIDKASIFGTLIHIDLPEDLTNSQKYAIFSCAKKMSKIDYDYSGNPSDASLDASIFINGKLYGQNKEVCRRAFQYLPELLDFKSWEMNLAHRAVGCGDINRDLFEVIHELKPEFFAQFDSEGNTPFHKWLLLNTPSESLLDYWNKTFPEWSEVKNKNGQTVVEFIKKHYEQRVNEKENAYQQAKEGVLAAQTNKNYSIEALNSICAIFEKSASGDTPAPDAKSPPRNLHLGNVPKNNGA